MIEAIGLKSMNDAEVREYEDLILSFVNEAGWIFCPDVICAAEEVCITD